MTSTKKQYDIIIIGGGIAGLYSAYNIQKISPTSRILVLERSKKQWLGGRMSNKDFYGVSVVTGAGIGRKNKDYLLIQLLNELKIPYNEIQNSPTYANTIKPSCNVKKIIMYLKTQYKTIMHDKNSPHVTFKHFALPILGEHMYQHFITCAGYTDYENEDAYDTLYHYGFDDNYADYVGLHIPWKLLIDTLYDIIGHSNIRTSSNVTNIEKTNHNPCQFTIHTEKEKDNIYLCNKVIIATNINGILKLVPKANAKNSIYQQIHGQPFLRLYGKFSKSSVPIMKHFVHGLTIVPGPLHQIITMDADKGVYMIAYTDNLGATSLKDYIKNTPENRVFFSRLVEKSLGIPTDNLHINALLDFYWPIGTHYYDPLRSPYKSRLEFVNHIQHPEPGMLVVGEAVSLNQGWTQGALDSVDKVVTPKWIMTNIC